MTIFIDNNNLIIVLFLLLRIISYMLTCKDLLLKKVVIFIVMQNEKYVKYIKIIVYNKVFNKLLEGTIIFDIFYFLIIISYKSLPPTPDNKNNNVGLFKLIFLKLIFLI